jgi:hypothetical protein
MRIYVALIFPWNEEAQQYEPTFDSEGAMECESNADYSGQPPVVGDVIQWDPGPHEEAPEGRYKVTKRVCHLGIHVEPHWDVTARWMPLGPTFPRKTYCDHKGHEIIKGQCFNCGGMVDP